MQKPTSDRKTVMNDDRLPDIHPGEILRLEFLEPLAITPYRLSKDIGVAQTRTSEILAAKRSQKAFSDYYVTTAGTALNFLTKL